MKIEFNDVSKMFDEESGLNNINLTIDRGIIGLLGVNGAGKTTFLRLLTGLIIPREGEIIINKTHTNKKEFNLDRIGYISSEDDLPKSLTVNKFVKIYKYMNSEKKSKINAIAKLLNFKITSKKKIKELSTGMFQKLKICLILGYDRDIYLLDEPTIGLDPVASKLLSDYLKQIANDKIIIYASHILEDIANLCNKVIVIKNNEIFKNEDVSNWDDLISKQREIYYEYYEKNQNISDVLNEADDD
ncbi:ABC transporter ATP-binding protein [Spiroplasma endosymbiont of Aspidapion aeneum]|uniref:ABC transporter ATP-binding protein n=1 Tax=Spiroplasma endosymbiont of Aspidapion aeneum TaxID=3066276 RepID=UPI00313E9C52